MTKEVGTPFIGLDVQRQPSLFWTLVHALKWLNDVSINFRIHLKNKGLAGPSKPSLNTPTIGSQKMKGNLMDPMHARGFLALLLNDGQRKKLRERENLLPPGTYLQGFEICKLFNLKPDPQDDLRIGAMSLCLERFLASRHMNNPSETYSITEKIHKWEDWVLKEFEDVMPAAKAGWMS